jgi:nucleotide-binding universal stress UspA family protein
MSLSRIVVGIDFSPESGHALAHAIQLGRREDARLTLVHVATVPPPLSELADDAWAALWRERLAADRARLGAMREQLSGQGPEISHVVVDGDPDTALAAAGDELGADLIVVGTHGRTGVRRLLLGSVAERTVRLATSSVLVARGEPPAGGYRRVVVGTDYSPRATRGIELAFAMVAPGGEVRVVHAWQPSLVEMDIGGELVNRLYEAAERRAANERERLLALPRPEQVSVRLELVGGVAFTALDDITADADLLVIGSHGRRGLRRWLLGSVAEATVRHAHGSVLVAR